MHRTLKTFAVSILLGGSPVLPCQRHQLTTFESKSGWTVRYPSSWRIASCHTCTDPRAANVYVDFFPPHSQARGGWILVEPLANKPTHVTPEAWLADVATNANQNEQINKESLSVNGLPALRVKYKTPQGELMEAIYVVTGLKTYSLGFSSEGRITSLEALRNYRVFTDLVRSFRTR